MCGDVSRDETQKVSEQSRDQLAVGMVATAENTEDVVTRIIRARQHGYGAVVTSPTKDCEALDFARALGATVVEPPDDRVRADSPKERLIATARTEGYSSLQYHQDPSRRIDYTVARETLADAASFVVPAPIEPAVEPEPTVLVGIPAYNEAETIGQVVGAASEHADEVLVVDDGSDDDTANRARAAGATVIEHGTNSGYGASLKTIFNQSDACRADHLVVLDADNQHDTDDIPKLVDAQRANDSPVAIGCRFGPETDTEMPILRRLGVEIINILMNISLGSVNFRSGIRDTQSGFRAYDRRAIESLATDNTIGDRMNASLDILYHAHANDYDIVEVPTTIDYEVDDGSSHGSIHHGLLLVMGIVRTIKREHPVMSLGIPGTAFMLVGLILDTGRFPTTSGHRPSR